ncbi:MAG TPA: hypothetical protein VFW40_10565, partial [Capsulimonadaceae bacterium]|nr:hypothetical protein [Capsulimonadaceae bacterium]
GQGNIITYTSPFLNFGNSGTNSYSVSLSGLSSKLGISNGLLSGFHSGGTGSFSTSPVPEVSTFASFGLLIAVGALLMIRQRRRSANES